MDKPKKFTAAQIKTGVKYKNSLFPGTVYLGVGKHGGANTDNKVGRETQIFKGTRRLVIIESLDEKYIGCVLHARALGNADYWNHFTKI